MAKPNPHFLIERNLSAQRWELCRAAYFMRTGKPDNAAKCRELAAHHRRVAVEESLAMSKK